MMNRGFRRTNGWYYRLRAVKVWGGVRVRLFARLSLAAVLLATFVALQALPLQAQTTTEVKVPYNWSLKPAGLAVGDQFRLLFLSSTKTDATATDIADYNTWIQERAAAGHDEIQDYSAGFRVVGCTADVDARDNTGTNTNTDGAGVPIYWLNGDKVADDNADFYDGDWDDEVNDKNESGNNGPNTSVSSQYPRTGCDHDGTEFIFNAMSNGLGMAHVMAGRPNNSTGSNGPISSGISQNKNSTRPMYGLSQVFEVAAPPEIIVPNDWGLIPSGLVSGDQFRLVFLSSTKAQRHGHRHPGLQHLDPGPRRGRPRRHPGLQRGVPGGGLH